ncbi:class I SAM-dependent methyltransferase [Solwaraspora sp. WMMA2065]|uniref:class I SAM-dependent methyltransferase n=1 Tax=Solwaraspora sp. WMMA2065 TaxID=3015166 RepID=UPI00259BE61D|nr:class I SAM-dependent methyltransferase [Solwaraspora sp. WMMA2065]WJK35181.1 methyltransferase domain-containing protein [Solwaraspora sp. WMMA2065]
MSASPARPDLRGVRVAYDTVAGDYAARMPDTRVEAPLDLAMIDTFAEAVRSSVDPLVLDAGCGAGRMSRYLADRDCRVVGVDLSPGMIAMARRDHRGLPFAVGSLADLPFPDSRFAGVLLWYSTIHAPPAGQGRVFAEAARVLHPGGRAARGVPAGPSRPGRRTRGPGGHAGDGAVTPGCPPDPVVRAGIRSCRDVTRRRPSP